MVSPNVIWPHQCTTTAMFCLENHLAPVPFEARQFSGTSDPQIPLPDSTTLHSLREHHSNVGIEAGKIVTERGCNASWDIDCKIDIFGRGCNTSLHFDCKIDIFIMYLRLYKQLQIQKSVI